MGDLIHVDFSNREKRKRKIKRKWRETKERFLHWKKFHRMDDMYAGVVLVLIGVILMTMYVRMQKDVQKASYQYHESVMGKE